MNAKPKPINSRAEYWQRERDLHRRLPLIDEVTVFSIDTPAPHYGRVCRPEHRRRRSAKWELRRINKATSMLPRRLKRYQKVVWAIYNYSPNVDNILTACGYCRLHYYRILALLWDFYSTKIRYFQKLNG